MEQMGLETGPEDSHEGCGVLFQTQAAATGKLGV